MRQIRLRTDTEERIDDGPEEDGREGEEEEEDYGDVGVSFDRFERNQIIRGTKQEPAAPGIVRLM